jgi:hypothetical protein
MFQLAELMVERQQVSQEFRNKLRKNRGYSSDESPFDSPSRVRGPYLLQCNRIWIDWLNPPNGKPTLDLVQPHRA